MNIESLPNASTAWICCSVRRKLLSSTRTQSSCASSRHWKRSSVEICPSNTVPKCRKPVRMARMTARKMKTETMRIERLLLRLYRDRKQDKHPTPAMIGRGPRHCC
jgi:hypothetical protein